MPSGARDEQGAALAVRGAPERADAEPSSRSRPSTGAWRSRAARTAGPRVSSRWSASVSSEGSAPSRESSSRSRRNWRAAAGLSPLASVPAHERAVGLLVGGVLEQHVLPAALGAQHREPALAQPRAWAEQPLLVGLVGQQFAAVG